MSGSVQIHDYRNRNTHVLPLFKENLAVASTEEIRRNVIASLPELELIQDQDLRNKVADAWTLSLEQNNFSALEEMDHSGRPGMFFSKQKSQADHVRGVAQMALKMGEVMKSIFPELDLSNDEIVAGALCHDLGKPGEYNLEHRKRWAADPGRTGKPSVRHTFYGFHIALTAGLPESIAHVAAMHAAEGEIVNRSTLAELVHFADDAYWYILLRAGIVEPGTPK